MDPSIFERVASRPLITDATIQRQNGDVLEIKVDLKTSRWDKEATVSTHSSLTLHWDTKAAILISQTTPSQFDPKCRIFTSVSPSGRHVVQGVMIKEKPHLQVDERLIPLENITALPTDPFFGNVDWSEDEQWFVFQGERKQPDLSDTAEIGPAGKFLYRPNWGERIPHLCSVGLFKLRIEDGQVSEVAAKCNPSQLLVHRGRVWFVNQHSIHYGLFYCPNRPSCLMSVRLADGEDEQTHSDWNRESVSLPSKDGAHLWYLSNPLGRSHHHSSTLVKFCIENGETTRYPAPDYSLFIDLVPNSQVQSGMPVYGVDRGSTRAIIQFDNGWNDLTASQPGSFKFLHRHSDWILALHSTRESYPRLVIGRVSEACWKLVYEAMQPANWPAKYDLETRVISLSKHVEVIVLKPRLQGNLISYG